MTTGEEDARGFYHHARTLVPDLRYNSSIVIANKLKEVWGCVPWKSGYQRAIPFPPLTELRARFEAKHGLQDWPGDSDGGGWIGRVSEMSATRAYSPTAQLPKGLRRRHFCAGGLCTHPPANPPGLIY